MSAVQTKLTLEERATNAETLAHIQQVQHCLNIVVRQLLERGELHDRTKLEPPEVVAFTEHTPHLAALTFGSPEYYAQLKQFQPALDHHYANNRHHPQHFKNGIDDMNLVDLIEMFCDWNASSKRHNDGNLHKSIEINAGRFGINPQLARILENSVGLFE